MRQSQCSAPIHNQGHCTVARQSLSARRDRRIPSRSRAGQRSRHLDAVRSPRTGRPRRTRFCAAEGLKPLSSVKANTQPAEPAPTITKSKTRLVVAMGIPAIHHQYVVSVHLREEASRPNDTVERRQRPGRMLHLHRHQTLLQHASIAIEYGACHVG